MTIGTSLGGFYEDEHHYESRDYMSEKGGKAGGNVADYNNVGIVINPGAPGTGLTQDQNEFTIEGGDLNDQPGLIKQASWQDNSEDFNNLPDDKYISQIDKSPGFFLGDAMQVQPWKKYSDRAKALTKQTYDLYKSGDTDVVEAVQDWERKTLTKGYNDTEAGQKLKKEAIDNYGSKTTMNKNALWETYMKHLQDLAGADLEDEKVPENMKGALEDLQLSDRVGRTQMDLKSLWAKGKYK